MTTTARPPTTIAQICPRRVLPVVVLEELAAAVPLRDALQSGGLSCVEVTLRTDVAEESIAQMATDPSFMVGAGTVMTPAQVRRVASAGARFVVSPGFSARVARECREIGLAYFPGVATPTEIAAALEHGLRELKFFPAEVLGGVPALKALAGPFREVSFMPTGGLSEANAAAYLALPSVAAVGGSWIATAALLKEGDFDEIGRRAARAAALSGRRAADVAGVLS